MDDAERVQSTVAQIYRLADEYQDDLSGELVLNLPEFHSFLRSIPYVTDQSSCGASECVKRPLVTRSLGGDCDDKTVFAGAYFNRHGLPWRVVTVSQRPDGRQNHVYPEVKLEGVYEPFDATYRESPYLVNPQFTTKIVWENPLMKIVPYGDNSGNFITLEQGKPPDAQWGSVLADVAKAGKFDIKTVTQAGMPILAAAIGQVLFPVPIVGAAVGALLGLVAGLIGVKGATAHLSLDAADKQATLLAFSVVTLYSKLPPEGKAYMEKAGENYLNDMMGRFATWWDGWLGKVWAKRAEQGLLSNPQNRMYWALHDTFLAVLLNADLTTVKENFQDWVIDRSLIPLMLAPTKKFIADKFRQVMEYNATGEVTTKDLPPPAGGGLPALATMFKNPIAAVLLVGAGVTAIGMMVMRKKSRRGRR